MSVTLKKKKQLFQCLLDSSMTLHLRTTLNTEEVYYSSQEALLYNVLFKVPHQRFL